MNKEITIRAMTSDDWALYRDLRLKALADAPDAFGSTLEAEQDLPDEHWHTRLERASTSGHDLPLMAWADGVPVALAYAKVDAEAPGVINLFQMWVDPAHRGQGIALAMLDSVVSWAKSLHATAVQLGVASGQGAAMRIYLKAGFTPSGLAEPLRAGAHLLSQPMRLTLDPLSADPPLH